MVLTGGGRVFDARTGLTWQRNVPSSPYKWLDALSYCVLLSIDGVTGWRLPSMKELHTLVDVMRSAPAIDQAAFGGTISAAFWSSSPAPFSVNHVGQVNFNSGTSQSNGPVTGGMNDPMASVRCVR